MRSATTAWSVACREPWSTPCTISVDDPAPSTSAPIDVNIAHRSPISGSRAALSMTVVPLALNYLAAFVDPERQFLHDRIAGTRIVQDR